MTPGQFDAAAMAIIRPSWADRHRYATPERQVAAIRALADQWAASRMTEAARARPVAPGPARPVLVPVLRTAGRHT